MVKLPPFFNMFTVNPSWNPWYNLIALFHPSLLVKVAEAPVIITPWQETRKRVNHQNMGFQNWWFSAYFVGFNGVKKPVNHPMKHRKKRWKDPLIPSMGRSTISMGHGFHVANSKKLPEANHQNMGLWWISRDYRKDYRMGPHSYKLVYKPLQPSLTIVISCYIMLYLP